MKLHTYRHLLAVAGAFVFYTNLAIYFSSPDTGGVSPWYWVAAFGVAAAPLLLGGARERMVHTPLLLWCAGYLLLSTVWVFFQEEVTEGVWQEMRLRLVSVLLLLATCAVGATPNAVVWARRALVFGVLLAVGLNCYELFYPMTFSSVQGRAAGLYVVSTQSGTAIVAGMALAVGVLPQRLRLLFVMVAGAGVAMTVSRGAVVTWVVTAALLVRAREIDLRRSLAVGGAALALAIAFSIPLWDDALAVLEERGVMTKDVTARLEGLTGREQIGADDSAWNRKNVAEAALDMFEARPLTGYGVAASKEWNYEMGPHNQYLALMVDHGFVGALLLPLLLLAVAWGARDEARRLALILGVMLLMAGWFSHHVLEDHYTLFVVGLLAAMSARVGPEATRQSALVNGARLRLGAGVA